MGSGWDDDDDGDEWKVLGDDDPASRCMDVYKEDCSRGPDMRTLSVDDRVVIRKQYLPDIDISLCYEWELQECRVIETTPDKVYLGTGRAGNGRKFWLDRRLINSVVKKVDTSATQKARQAKRKTAPRGKRKLK